MKRTVGMIGSTVAAVVAVTLGGAEFSYASENPEAPDMMTTTASVDLSQAQVDKVMEGASEADGVERRAVDTYLDSLPVSGSYLTADDLQVGSVPVSGNLTATFVAPEAAVDIRSIDVGVNADTNEITAGAKLGTVQDAEPGTAGPGMGSWPSWSDSPSWALEMKLSVNGNWIGTGTFQTQRRKYQNDGNSSQDLWQVARYARGTPDALEYSAMPDIAAKVKTLWISNNLTDAAYANAQQWRSDLTNPDEGFASCSSSGGSIKVGPFDFTPSNCDDYDVWQGRVGHYRMAYDQGTYAGGGQRSTAYVAGWSMDNGAAPSSTWYEFITLRLGPWTGDTEFRCNSTSPGTRYETERGSCAW